MPQVFYSTNKQASKATLEDAVMLGLAADGGLFQLETIPQVSPLFFERLHNSSFSEIAFEVATLLLQDSVPTNELQKMTEYPFEPVLKKIEANLYCLELFHGPTLSFKDFGAFFMANLVSYFIRKNEKTLHILVATSGDTGSAIGNGFLNTPNTKVWILYPKGKISKIQEMQIATLNGNVTAIEVEGTFDDCQKLVKQAFNDADLRKKMLLTSANSINIGRLIAQVFYYFYGFAQSENPLLPQVFSVPSGNFGNLTAGLLAKKMGLPILKFVGATNVNDTVPKYLETGKFQAQTTKHTISNAMDVGNPSNFARMLDLYNNDWDAMKRDVVGVSFTDVETENAIRDVQEKYGYIMDPHSAVAYLGLKSYMKKSSPVDGIFLGTAHPAKFATDVERILGQHIDKPKSLVDALSKKKRSIPLHNNYQDLKDLFGSN